MDVDRNYRELVRSTFAEQYQVLEASCVEDTLTHIAAHAQDGNFAVILSMTLPEQGAAQILQTVRQNSKLWRVPVLATLPQDPTLEAQALALDADDFIGKPHTRRGLQKRISQLMSLAEHYAREKMLQDEACCDYLTGLLNRRGLQAAIDTLRQEDLPLALFLFDLDNLKKVNDQFGHEKGDELLIAFGKLLRSKTREGDILCRYGGDEFVVILRRLEDREAVLRKSMEICSSIQECHIVDGFCASCSGGAVVCGSGERPSAELIRKADRALYGVKQVHKGTCYLLES